MINVNDFNGYDDNEIIENAITKNGLENTCIRREIIIENQPVFNIELPESKRYHQKDSWKCWIFAGLNLIKHNIAKNLNMNVILVVSIGLLCGSFLLIIGDKISSRFVDNEENNFRRILLLVTSIVLHNIPEGLAIGVAFGSIIYNIEGATLIAAISLAIGIGIQNIPEGAAISIPLRKEGLSRKKAFIVGSLSGIVEPLSAILGVILVLKIKVILPILLAFASGAMLFVIIEELVPECMNDDNKNMIGIVTLIGFIAMMALELL